MNAAMSELFDLVQRMGSQSLVMRRYDREYDYGFENYWVLVPSSSTGPGNDLEISCLDRRCESDRETLDLICRVWNAFPSLVRQVRGMQEEIAELQLQVRSKSGP